MRSGFKASLLLLILFGFLPSCRQSTGNPEYFTNTIPSPAEFRIDYIMTRTFTDHLQDPPRQYDEKIWYKSNGDFRIEYEGIYDLAAGQRIPCAPQELEKENLILRDSRARFVLFERGFQIRDPELFLNNYNYIILNPRETYLNRRAVVVQIEPRIQDRPGYTVWLDRETGLILKYIEKTPMVDPTTVMEVTSLDLDPDLSQVEFFAPPLDEEPILGDLGESGFGFPIRKPFFLLPGFAPQTPCKVVLGSGMPVLKLVFTDGVQRILILEHDAFPDNANWVTDAGKGDFGLHHSSIPGLPVDYRFFLGRTQFQVSANLDKPTVATIIESLFHEGE